MLKFRITGLPDDVQRALKQLTTSFSILSASPVYQNRNSKYVRIYADVDFKTEHSTCVSKEKSIKPI